MPVLLIHNTFIFALFILFKLRHGLIRRRSKGRARHGNLLLLILDLDNSASSLLGLFAVNEGLLLHASELFEHVVDFNTRLDWLLIITLLLNFDKRLSRWRRNTLGCKLEFVSRVVLLDEFGLQSLLFGINLLFSKLTFNKLVEIQHRAFRLILFSNNLCLDNAGSGLLLHHNLILRRFTFDGLL